MMKTFYHRQTLTLNKFERLKIIVCNSKTVKVQRVANNSNFAKVTKSERSLVNALFECSLRIFPSRSRVVFLII